MPTRGRYNPASAKTALQSLVTTAEMRQGHIHTRVSRSVAWTMILLFLGIILTVPISELVAEFAEGKHLRVLNLFTMGRFPTKGDLRQYEETLEERSLLVRYVQPRMQEMLTSRGGFASSNVVLGQEDWLFYRPGVDSVTGNGFLEPITLRTRARNLRDAVSTETISSDPRPAILEFHWQVRAAGGHLVLMPTPDKASIHAAQLSRAAQPFPVNPSWVQFVQEMRAAGVDVFDATPRATSSSQIRFLRHDTHWTPQWMDDVSNQLAAHIQPMLSAREPTTIQLEQVSVSNMGDLVEMLRLPATQQRFLPQRVILERVRSPKGESLRPDNDSDVLLLGDSFANIYSAAQMGWGESSGLPEHLAYHLHRPVDWIARNDAGAHATREILSGQMAQGRNRLAGKKVVIWQFTARELSFGDWKHIEITPIPATATTKTH